MPIVYETVVKTARMQATVDQFGPGAKLQLFTAGYAAMLAEHVMGNPSGTVSGAVLTLSGFPQTVAGLSGGNAAVARIVNSSGAVRASGMTVGTAGTDIIVDNVNVAVGQDVRITSATITHAA